MTSSPIIQVKNVTKAVQQKAIVQACNMSIKEQSIYALLGPNGAGKTTLLKLITGYIYPTTGKIKVLGKDISTNRTNIIKNIGSIIEAPVFYEHLSATENINIHLSYMGIKSDQISHYLDMVGLSHTGNQPVSQFSMGMRQLLGIARAISHQPKILILDEPINGLDPMGIRLMRELFSTLVKENGMTILISSHILNEIEQTADTIGFISNGTIIEEDSISSIKKKSYDRLEDYYFNVIIRGQKHDWSYET